MDELQRMAAPVVARWERLTRSQRFVIIAICAASAVGISCLWNRSAHTEWQPIAAGRDFSTKEIAAIQSAWRRSGLTGFQRSGGMLNVPKADFAKYQAALPKSVEPDAGAVSEWERQLNALTPFTSSEQIEQRKDTALRNELRRVLKAIPAIADADVIWAKSRSRATFSGKTKVTATVNITPKDGHDVTPELAQSLRSAVASMIPDLSPADIVVLDQSTGLAVPYEPDATWIARQQQRRAERSAKQLEQQIGEALSHLGEVAVRVTKKPDRKVSAEDAWRISITVPDASFAAQAARQNRDLNVAKSELRRDIAALLPAEFADAEIRIATQAVEVAVAESSSKALAAWPHLICFGIATFCIVLGCRPKRRAASSQPVVDDPTNGTAPASVPTSRDRDNVPSPLRVAAHVTGATPSKPDTDLAAEMVRPECVDRSNNADRTQVVNSTLAASRSETATLTSIATLQGTPANRLAEAFHAERPQAIAVLATRLPTRLVSDTLARLPNDIQLEVIRRLKSLGEIPDDLVQEIAQTVCRRLAAARLESTRVAQPVNRIVAHVPKHSPPEKVAA